MRNSQNNILGLICIIGGALLLIFGAPLLWYIVLSLIGLWLINYGLQLRGSPPLTMWLQRWYDEIRFYFFKK